MLSITNIKYSSYNDIERLDFYLKHNQTLYHGLSKAKNKLWKIVVAKIMS